MPDAESSPLLRSGRETEPAELRPRRRNDPRLWPPLRLAAIVGIAAVGAAGLVDAATAGNDLDLSVAATTAGVLSTQRFGQAALSIALLSLIPRCGGAVPHV